MTMAIATLTVSLCQVSLKFLVEWKVRTVLSDRLKVVEKKEKRDIHQRKKGTSTKSGEKKGHPINIKNSVA